MNWKTVRHEELTPADSRRIAALKDQHWPFGLDSQLRWMQQNTRAGDLHLLGQQRPGDAERLTAYMTLFAIRVQLDDTALDAIGVGCVCVDKTAQRRGLGRQLLQEAARLIRERQKPGFLLCKDSLTGFYEKCGWSLLPYGSATVAGTPYDKCIMTLDALPACAAVQLDRNF